jgi:single-strand DNA-binding protein
MALGKVLGIYRLSAEVELKYLPSGAAVAKLQLVNSTKFKSASGEQKEESCFISGSIFGKMAEIANQYLKKGSKIFIDAELKQETWIDKDEKKQSRHSLKIASFEMLDSKSDNQSQPAQKKEPTIEYQRYVPEIDIDESEIPF